VKNSCNILEAIERWPFSIFLSFCSVNLIIEEKEWKEGYSVKWTILGYQSPFPGPGGATPGYLLEVADQHILIDCGSGVVSQLGKYLLPWKLDAVLLSHLHHDHTVDIPILHYALLIAKKLKERIQPLPVYLPSHPSELANRIMHEEYIQSIFIDGVPELQLAGITIRYLQTEHEIACFAMEISNEKKSIIYTADTGPETDWSRFKKSPDLLIVEGTFLEKNVPSGKRGHLTVGEAAGLAERLSAKKCIITHLSPTYDRNEVLMEAKRFFHGELFIAEIGLVVEV
jgi:ribonuclease BN (tRNA processing enzyme)